MTGNDDQFDAASSFLDDRDDGERALDALLAVQDDHDTWTFADVDLDSGEFGELVSRGLVTAVDDEYRVADPDAVRSALDGDRGHRRRTTTAASSGHDVLGNLRRWIHGIDERAVAGLVGALLLVVAARSIGYAAVFQDSHVVSPANDPYYFRYWMEQLAASASGPTDLGVLDDPAFGTGEVRPMSHATNWFLVELLGGDESAARTVAAWLPVVSAVAVGAMIYRIATLLTSDVRVGLAAVVVFAGAPINAVYTGVGFFDHQLHQYLWLGVTLLSLTWLSVDVRRRWRSTGDPWVRDHVRSPRTWAVAAVLGCSVAFGTHSWGGSPLLLLPLAAYVALRVAMDIREGLAPIGTLAPTVGGLAFGALIAAGLNEGWGWHEQFVAYAPAMILAGSIAVLAVGELWRRRDWHLGGLLAVDVTLASVGLVLLSRVATTEWNRAQERLDDLLFRSGATETASLFSTEYYVIFGPLYQVGVSFYVGLAVLGWVAWLTARRYEPGWLLLGVYTGSLLVVAGIQVRFAGQLVVPLSVLAGLGFVYLLSTVDLARRPALFRRDDAVDAPLADRADGGPSIGAVDEPRPSAPTPERESDDSTLALPDLHAMAYVLGIAFLVLGLNLLYVPSLTSDTTYGDDAVASATAIETDAASHGLTYPGNYVLSPWDENRMLNYVVSGESESYGYAQNQYPAFLGRTSPGSTYDKYSDRVGYVVVESIDGTVGEDTMQHRLLGSLQDGERTLPALAHYRLLSVDDARTTAAYALVPGARLTGTTEPGQQVTVNTSLSISGESFTYSRTTTANENGSYTLALAYPGEYQGANATISVSAAAVANGTTVRAGRA